MSNRAFAWEWLFLLCSDAELEASHLYQSTAMWMCERSQMKSQFPQQISRADYFISAASSWHHLSGRSSCFTPNRSAILYYMYIKHQHFFVSAYEYSICLPLLILHNRRFKCERGELQGVSVLSFAAVSNVHSFVPKLHGASTKRHQVMTVVVCFFNYCRNAFWSVR